LSASSIQTAPDGYRRIVWMIKRMIMGHPTEIGWGKASDSGLRRTGIGTDARGNPRSPLPGPDG
jgi:hypothetical protein